MSSVPVWHKIKTFVCPSGKRRKVRCTTSQTADIVMPPKPIYPPKPSRAPVAALPGVPEMIALEQRIMEQVGTGRAWPRSGELVREFGELYRGTGAPEPTVTGRMHVEPPPYQLVPRNVRPAPVTRVVLRSDNPEMDRTIVAGTSRLPKILVRPEVLESLTPVALPELGTTGMRITLAQPSPAPVSDRTPVYGVAVPASLSGASTAVMERDQEDTQDFLITDEWREMFRTETAHVCRGCLKWSSGIAGDNGRWICGRCHKVDRY